MEPALKRPLEVPTPSRGKGLATPEGMRLRLLTLFALYDALPHSIANSPDGDSPMDLDSAIEASVVQHCLQSMEELGTLSVGEAHALSATYAPSKCAAEEEVMGGSWNEEAPDSETLA